MKHENFIVLQLKLFTHMINHFVNMFAIILLCFLGN